MSPQLRELVRKVVAGELSDAEARRVIAAARKVVDAQHQAFLNDLSAVITAEKTLAQKPGARRHNPSAVQV